MIQWSSFQKTNPFNSSIFPSRVMPVSFPWKMASFVPPLDSFDWSKSWNLSENSKDKFSKLILCAELDFNIQNVARSFFEGFENFFDPCCQAYPPQCHDFDFISSQISSDFEGHFLNPLTLPVCLLGVLGVKKKFCKLLFLGKLKHLPGTGEKKIKLDKGHFRPVN